MAQGGIDEYVHRIGRTGRIGHQGKATSFYNDRNEDMGEALVNLLIETDQPIPDFLAHLKPEDGKATFDDDTGDEEEDNYTADAGGGFGGGDEAPAGGNAWGSAAPAAAVTDSAWGPAPAATGTASAW